VTGGCEGVCRKRVGLYRCLFVLYSGNNQQVRVLENRRSGYILHTNLKKEGVKKKLFWMDIGVYLGHQNRQT
jgi:hypothetical protein